ncbi:GTP:AMP phosphotransferase AK3, mitochondrial-like [Ctenocephalides felis]|uniref:GTP:AMP phosphotransferase AK3, mitochondrial-like n=1 Tax=Ctenocephalides felis TaxID=7515 RepID=UPI000E6E58A5|nr:GTP:AMP phosphotransferase AK3, mitochondrial-like [Ctenocephalides felis]
MIRAVILGAPASGKGTISSRITKTFNMQHISSGDKLRAHIENQTDLGKVAKKYINDGRLVPDSFMIKFIHREIASAGSIPWLLDGYPRTLPQAEALWSAYPLDMVINLTVPFDVIIDRVKSRWIHLSSGRVYNVGFNEPKIPGKDDITGEPLEQREDDQPASVKKRLTIYENLTRPVIEFYRKKGILHDFKGNTSDEIWPHVQKLLNRYNQLKFIPELEKLRRDDTMSRNL